LLFSLSQVPAWPDPFPPLLRLAATEEATAEYAEYAERQTAEF
jgi:hypothetical protein